MSPIREINAIIELKNNDREIFNTPVFSDGKFVFADMLFYDTAKFYYQFNNDKKKDLTERATFEIRNNFLKNNLTIKPDSTSLININRPDTVIMAKNIAITNKQLSEAELQKVKTLKEVFITGRKKSKEELMDEQYATGLFTGGNSKMFLPENDPGFLTSRSVLDYLQARVGGLRINTIGAEPSISWRGSSTALYMNEIEEDINMIMNIPMSDVAMIKVFSPPFFGYGGGGGGGAVAVYLKNGATGYPTRARGMNFISVAGYSPVKEFYSPDYSKDDQPYTRDYRKTLYWNPFVITGKNNRRIYLSFYNNDITKNYKIIIDDVTLTANLHE